MKHPIHFVGAGPGDPELITVKGWRLLEEADCVVYAGSLVPDDLLACCKAGTGKRSQLYHESFHHGCRGSQTAPSDE